MNRHFRPPSEPELSDDENRSHVRAQFFDTRSRFIDRLGCAQVFDRELFEALLLWLDTLRRSYEVVEQPMSLSDFSEFRRIEGLLEQEATYSRDQRTECTAALTEWRDVMERYGISPGSSQYPSHS